MANLFTTILNMSMTASIIIGIVLLARLCLSRAPKIFSYVLWSVVLFRLLCPVSISLPVSVLAPMADASTSAGTSYTASMEYISLPQRTESEQTQQSAPGENNIPDSADGIDESAAITDLETNTSPVIVEQEKMSAGEIVLTVLGWLWVAGMAGVLGMTTWQTVSLKRRLADACIIRGNIYESDKIDTAFILGVFNPKIYLPLGLPFDIQKTVVAHEQTHQRRGDHIVKLMSYVALAIHWFNPLVWLSFKLMCDDMEKSCDEAVIREMKKRGYTEKSVKKAYSEMLFSFGYGKQNIFSPVSFAEHSTKERVINVINCRKFSRNAGVVLCATCVLVCFVCLMNPVIGNIESSPDNEEKYGLVFSLDRTDKNGRYINGVTLPQDESTFAAVIDYTGNEEKVVIPESYQGYPVKAIANGAFENSTAISIYVPESITHIGNNAFKNCMNLSSVSIPDSVTEIKSETFYGCSSLENVSLPDTIISIGEKAFWGCSALTELELPNSLFFVSGSEVFAESGVEHCISKVNINNYIETTTNIADLYIGGDYFMIDDYGFSAKVIDWTDEATNETHMTEREGDVCAQIKNVEISGSIKQIGIYAFLGCNNLETVKINDGVRFIGGGVFKSCNNLLSITLPDSIHTISDDMGLGFNSSVTIYCNPGSYAEEWASLYNLKVEYLKS